MQLAIGNLQLQLATSLYGGGGGDGDGDGGIRLIYLVPWNSIAIFGYKQWLLSIDMETKVVQHVPTINI